MTKVEIPEGSGNHYRYEYDQGKTHYKGPVGGAPALSEDQFLYAVQGMSKDQLNDAIKWDDGWAVDRMLDEANLKPEDFRSVIESRWKEETIISSWVMEDADLVAALTDGRYIVASGSSSSELGHGWECTTGCASFTIDFFDNREAAMAEYKDYEADFNKPYKDYYK